MIPDDADAIEDEANEREIRRIRQKRGRQMSETTMTHMPPYHEYKPYGLRCQVCSAPEFASIHQKPMPQPEPDAGGEWRVEAMPTHGWRVVDATGQEVIADVYRKEDAAQIVSDHNAIPKLVTAIESEAARRAYAAGLGVSEWRAFLWSEAVEALALVKGRE